MGKETTLREDVYEIEEMMPIIQTLGHQVSQHLKSSHLAAKNITLKVKFHDFKQITKSISVQQAVNDAAALIGIVYELLLKVQLNGNAVRLLGIYTSKLQDIEDDSHAAPHYEQLTLFG